MVRTHLRVAVQSCLVLSALLLFDSSSAFGQATNPFFAPPTFSGKGQALTADVNGDGKADLLYFDGTVLLGKGDGTFTTGTPWRSTASPNPTANQFAIADFNGDGKQDIFIVGPLNVLSVMLGNGDGTFQASKTTSISTPATAFLVGDLNGDGKPDVLAQLNGGTFVYLGKGDGTFGAGIATNAASPQASAAFADFNGDGKLDLLVSGSGIQLGNGDGTFQALLPFPAGAFPGLNIFGDFDGDGKLDVLATGGSPTQIQVLFGNGDGTFHAGSTQSVPANTGLLNFVAVDLNGDGKSDLVGSTGTSAVQGFISKGDGSFSLGPLYNAPAGTSGTGAANMVAADFNGDGKKDVSAFNTMFLGKGDGTYMGDEAVPGITGGGVTGDFNGDGHPDLALITSGTTNNTMNLNIWLNDGKPNLTLAHTYTITIPSPGADISGEVVISAAVDINGDGKTDLVGYLWDGAGLNALVLLGHGDGSFGAQILSVINNQSVSGNSSVSVAVGDLNNDGKPDIVAPTFGTFGGALSIVLGNGDGTFGAPSTPFVGTPGLGLALGDFNNDKKLDVILETGNGLGVLLGNGDGTFQPTTFVQASNACFCGNMLSGDFNGDGNLDLMIATGTGYQILAGKGDGTFTGMPAVTDSLGAFSGTQVADFNGDGHLDVLGQSSPQSGSPLGLILGKSDGTFSAPFNYSVSGIPLVADFNGDGKPDLALLGTTQLVWLFNNGTAVTPPPPTGPDFSVGSGSGSGTATVAAGSTATYPLSLAGTGGFTGNVALTCSVSPAGPACSVSPSSVTVSGSTAATATVSVTTTARSGLLPIGGSNERDSSRRILWIFGSLVAAAGIISFLANAQTRPRRFSWSLAKVCGALLLVSATLMSGCGGSNSSNGSTGSIATGTSAGNYTVTVTAQSGSVSHNTQLTLTVK